RLEASLEICQDEIEVPGGHEENLRGNGKHSHPGPEGIERGQSEGLPDHGPVPLDCSGHGRSDADDPGRKDAGGSRGPLGGKSSGQGEGVDEVEKTTANRRWRLMTNPLALFARKAPGVACLWGINR